MPFNSLNSYILGDIYYIDCLKETCRTKWFLTVTEMKHMSQMCKTKTCKFCKNASNLTIDLSDEDINNKIDGTICLFEQQYGNQ